MSHWTTDEVQIEKFNKAVGGQGYTPDEALDALGVEKITDLRGGIGDTLTQLQRAKKQAASDAPTALIVTQADTAITTPGWGSQSDVSAIALRLRTMMPGGENMTDGDAMALAQYSLLMNLNPFRGEVYGYHDKGKFKIADGYKAMARWARKQCPYSEKYVKMDDDDQELPDGAIGYRCYILRNDAREMLQMMTQAGASFQEAFEIAAVYAVGIVSEQDRHTKRGEPYSAPTGWTWDQVARKRAMKNTLNLSHGAPSPREIAAESWDAGGVETSPTDWTTDDATAQLSDEARVRLAQMHARERQKPPETRTPDQVLEHNRSLLRGNPSDDVLVGEIIDEPQDAEAHSDDDETPAELPSQPVEENAQAQDAPPEQDDTDPQIPTNYWDFISYVIKHTQFSKVEQITPLIREAGIKTMMTTDSECNFVAADVFAKLATYSG